MRGSRRDIDRERETDWDEVWDRDRGKEIRGKQGERRGLGSR
jgi:hypothetical protein